MDYLIDWLYEHCDGLKDWEEQILIYSTIVEDST